MISISVTFLLWYIILLISFSIVLSGPKDSNILFTYRLLILHIKTMNEDNDYSFPCFFSSSKPSVEWLILLVPNICRWYCLDWLWWRTYGSQYFAGSHEWNKRIQMSIGISFLSCWTFLSATYQYQQASYLCTSSKLFSSNISKASKLQCVHADSKSAISIWFWMTMYI